MKGTLNEPTSMIFSRRETLFLRIHQRKTLSYRTFGRLNGFQQKKLIKELGRNKYTWLALSYMALKKRDGEPVRVREAIRFSKKNFIRYKLWEREALSSGVIQFSPVLTREDNLFNEFLFLGFKPYNEVNREPDMCYIESNIYLNGTRMVHPQPCYGYITKRRDDTPDIYEFQSLNGIPGYTRVKRPPDEVDGTIGKKSRKRKL